MRWLTQSRFPFLWNCFQWAMGGTVDKRRLCLKYYSGQDRVLEIGCSVGNIAVAFLPKPGLRYVGVDDDAAAIALAQKQFARVENFSFHCRDVTRMADFGEPFDYILLAGVLHHTADAVSRDLLHAAMRLLDDAGLLVVVDPILPEPRDSSFLRIYLRMFEQGQHVRSRAAMETLLNSEPGLIPCGAETCLIGATPMRVPAAARFGIWRFCKQTASRLASSGNSVASDAFA